jgi:hypothetical protein
VTGNRGQPVHAQRRSVSQARFVRRGGHRRQAGAFARCTCSCRSMFTSARHSPGRTAMPLPIFCGALEIILTEIGGGCRPPSRGASKSSSPKSGGGVPTPLVEGPRNHPHRNRGWGADPPCRGALKSSSPKSGMGCRPPCRRGARTASFQVALQLAAVDAGHRSLPPSSRSTVTVNL